MTETKSGNVILREIDVPNQVAPGETFEATVTVSNGAGYINPLDGDKCGLVPPGYKIEVVCEGPDGTRSTDDCITTTEVGTRDEQYEFVFTAPSGGENSTTVEAHVEMRGSGMSTDDETATVTVSDSAPAQSDSEGDSDNPFDLPSFGSGGGGGGGGGGLPSFVPDVGIQTIGLGLAGLLLIVAVIS
jgi:hypothetical protein